MCCLLPFKLPLFLDLPTRSPSTAPSFLSITQESPSHAEPVSAPIPLYTLFNHWAVCSLSPQRLCISHPAQFGVWEAQLGVKGPGWSGPTQSSPLIPISECYLGPKLQVPTKLGTCHLYSFQVEELVEWTTCILQWTFCYIYGILYLPI